jgi:hypothetical protein
MFLCFQAEYEGASDGKRLTYTACTPGKVKLGFGLWHIAHILRNGLTLGGEHNLCPARIIFEALLCIETLATPRWRMQA